MFEYTAPEEIESFLCEYQKNKTIIETTSRSTLNYSLQFEKKNNKPFYDFTKDEILAMYKEAKSTSVRSLQNKNLLLKEFANYICSKKNTFTINIYNCITKEDLLICVDEKKRETLILSREYLTKLQNELINYTDKGILEALFLGLGGYKLKELAFFNVQNIMKENIISLQNKNIPISQEQRELLLRACCETNLMSFGWTMRESENISHGLFKERFNALTSSSSQDKNDLERRYRFFQRRLMLISNYTGLNITSSKVQESGFLHFLKIELKNSGKTFEEYIKTKDAKKLANRYDICTDLYPQVIKEKFERHFNQ